MEKYIRSLLHFLFLLVFLIDKSKAWHIPCYAHHNCANNNGGSKSGSSLNRSQQANIFSVFDWNLTNVYDWLTFIFLMSVFIISFGGLFMVIGSLFVREWRVSQWYLRRPINHFLLAILTSDIIMTLLVIPLHLNDLLGGESKELMLNPGTCVFRICSHFLSVTSKSWCIVAYIVLYHIHNGVISTQRSIAIGLWTWLMSILISVPGVLFGIDNFIDTEKCTLTPSISHWPMILYITVIPFILPSCILTPCLLIWSNLRKKLKLNQNISSEYLAQYDDVEDQENQEIASKYYKNRHNNPSIVLGKGHSPVLPEICIENIEEEFSSEESTEEHSVTSSINNIAIQTKYEPSSTNDSLMVPSHHERVSSFSRASKGTINFLCQDKNFPRLLFTLGIVHTVLWLPFFIVLILGALLSPPIERPEEGLLVIDPYIALSTLWLGYIETAITPILIYLLSSFVNKVIKQVCTDIFPCCSHQRRHSISETAKIVIM